jgi:glycosyltransferase involved in cell wall biosynthesis
VTRPLPHDPRLSVVLTTYNRADVLPRAMGSVLGRGSDAIEFVVDDGSTDSTPSVLAEVDHPRIMSLRRPNGGLGAARNTGFPRARGEWAALLDDDEALVHGWFSALFELAGPEVDIGFGGARNLSPTGVPLDEVLTQPMGPLFDHQNDLAIAGAWAARSDLVRTVSGYGERLTCSHQTDFLARHVPEVLTRGMTSVGAQIVLRPPSSGGRRVDRPMPSVRALYGRISVLVDKHREQLGRDAYGCAALHGVLGVNAARLGQWERGALTDAVAEPCRGYHWLRVGAACVPPVARRIWPPVPQHVAAKDLGHRD